MLFSPHSTEEKYWPSSLLMVVGKHFMDWNLLQATCLDLVFIHCRNRTASVGLTERRVPVVWHTRFVFERSRFQMSVRRPAVLRFLVGFLSPYREMSIVISNYTIATYFYVIFKSLSTNYSIVRYNFIVGAIERFAKSTEIKINVWNMLQCGPVEIHPKFWRKFGGLTHPTEECCS